ncbi:hypothetical protein K490DRAFT_54851 [Saccharata proteae CBS 121410]|uniref:Uncharacterized protein n=1 Tax=Saccharata proteae CBS 121410 TaxID=1314787 RepID=A0A6A5YBI2_9PEZI|nr:hypothetical protein K490DRAFT_54851 [Saccharata proteae CBS 121410]
MATFEHDPTSSDMAWNGSEVLLENVLYVNGAYNTTQGSTVAPSKIAARNARNEDFTAAGDNATENADPVHLTPDGDFTEAGKMLLKNAIAQLSTPQDGTDLSASDRTSSSFADADANATEDASIEYLAPDGSLTEAGKKMLMGWDTVAELSTPEQNDLTASERTSGSSWKAGKKLTRAVAHTSIPWSSAMNNFTIGSRATVNANTVSNASSTGTASAVGKATSTSHSKPARTAPYPAPSPDHMKGRSTGEATNGRRVNGHQFNENTNGTHINNNVIGHSNKQLSLPFIHPPTPAPAVYSNSRIVTGYSIRDFQRLNNTATALSTDAMARDPQTGRFLRGDNNHNRRSDGTFRPANSTNTTPSTNRVHKPSNTRPSSARQTTRLDNHNRNSLASKAAGKNSTITNSLDTNIPINNALIPANTSTPRPPQIINTYSLPHIPDHLNPFWLDAQTFSERYPNGIDFEQYETLDGTSMYDIPGSFSGFGDAGGDSSMGFTGRQDFPSVGTAVASGYNGMGHNGHQAARAGFAAVPRINSNGGVRKNSLDPMRASYSNISLSPRSHIPGSDIPVASATEAQSPAALASDNHSLSPLSFAALSTTNHHVATYSSAQEANGMARALSLQRQENGSYGFLDLRTGQMGMADSVLRWNEGGVVRQYEYAREHSGVEKKVVGGEELVKIRLVGMEECVTFEVKKKG